MTKPERRDERVFVSHTSELATWPSPVSYVRAAQDIIESANMRPVDMSHFAAEDRPPLSVCEGRVRTSDIYVGVIGLRYGTVVPGRDVSYTEFEFDVATDAGIPRIIILLSDTIPGLPHDQDRERIDRFCHRLRSSAGLTVAAAMSLDDAELHIFRALVAYRDHAKATRNFVGALIEARDLAGLKGREETKAAVAWATRRLQVADIPDDLLDHVLSGNVSLCPDWATICRPLVVGFLDAATRPDSPASRQGRTLGAEYQWRDFYYAAVSGEADGEASWPFERGIREPGRAPTDEQRAAKLQRENERAAVLSGQGVAKTLRRLYPSHDLVDLWGTTFPISVFPAPPSQYADIEASLLEPPADKRLPRRTEYSPTFDQEFGKPAFDRSNARYDQLDEVGRRYFFSGSTYAFESMRFGPDGAPRLRCKLSRYFVSGATSEDLDPELMAALQGSPDEPAADVAMPRRMWLHQSLAADPIDDPVLNGRTRGAALSHATVVMLSTGEGSYDILLPHRSENVYAHAHFNHVSPSGIFSPHDESDYPSEREFSVERNFFREWVEELYAAEEHERPKFVGAPDPEGEPEVLRLKAMIRNGLADLYYTGVSVNLLTLRPEICLLLLIHDPTWLKREETIATDIGRPLRFGWEYAQTPQQIRYQAPDQLDHWRLRIDAAELRPLDGTRLSPSFLVPNAAAAISLAITMLRQVRGFG